jgi:hypothetical protein
MLVKEVFKNSAIRFFTPLDPNKVADKDAQWLLDVMFKSTYGKNITPSQREYLYEVLDQGPECSEDGRWSAAELEFPLRESIHR